MTKKLLTTQATTVFPNLIQTTTKNNRKMKKAKKETIVQRQINGVKVELMLDNRYAQKNNTYAICVRLYHERKYHYLKTGYSLTPQEFKNPSDTIRNSLLLKFDNVCAKVIELNDKGLFCFELFKDLDFDKTTPQTLCELLREKVKISDITEGTKLTYKVTEDRLVKCFDGDIYLKQVNTDTMQRFSDWMLFNGYRNSSIAISLQNIKSSINYAIYKGWLKPEQYPFKKHSYEIDKVSVPKSEKRSETYISKEDIDNLYSYWEKTGDTNIKYFLLSYYLGGINFADLVKLEWSERFDKEGCIVYNRQKTEKKNKFYVCVPLCSKARTLLSGLNYGDKLITCKSSERAEQSNVNAHLKRLSKKLGVKHLSFGVARHSFATIATKIGMPFSMIEYAMAHSNNGVSSFYVGSWKSNEMLPWFEQL